MKNLKQSVILFFLLPLFAGCQIEAFEQLKSAETSEQEKAAFTTIAEDHDDFSVVLEREDGTAIGNEDLDQEIEDNNVFVKITLLGGKWIRHQLIDKENLDALSD